MINAKKYKSERRGRKDETRKIQPVKTGAITLFITLTCIAITMVSATAQVKSKTFNFVLKTMLSGDVPTITVADAAKTTREYVFLDAREEEEYGVSHLPNAKFVGYKNFDLSHVKNIPKEKPIVVYCAIGKRSEDITEKLTKAGYKNVKNLYGGIFEWVNQDHEVYDNQNRKTLNVHAYNRLWGRFLDKGNKVYQVTC